MQCPSCGTTLSPGTAICPRCGTHLSYTSDSDELAYIEYGAARQETAPPSPQAGDTPGQSHDSTGTLQERPSSDSGLQSGEIIQPFSQQLSPGTLEPVQGPGVPPAPQQARNFSAVTVILLIILLLLLVTGGSGPDLYEQGARLVGLLGRSPAGPQSLSEAQPSVLRAIAISPVVSWK